MGVSTTGLVNKKSPRRKAGGVGIAEKRVFAPLKRPYCACAIITGRSG